MTELLGISSLVTAGSGGCRRGKGSSCLGGCWVLEDLRLDGLDVWERELLQWAGLNALLEVEIHPGLQLNLHGDRLEMIGGTSESGIDRADLSSPLVERTVPLGES